MELTDTSLTDVFAAILTQQGITAPIDGIEVQGLHDEPGFHWSNPGLKAVTVTAGGHDHPFVVKRLRERSKREVLVYRFLSGYPDFPAPRLYHHVYDDAEREYWVVIERCVPRPLGSQEAFCEQCGLVLARLHAAFWDRTDALPDFFHQQRTTARSWAAVLKLSGYPGSLSQKDRAALVEIAGAIVGDLEAALGGIDRAWLESTPPAARCLIHKAFHPPEIAWREVSDGYEPVAVDWETATVGAPQEDFRVAGTLIAEGKEPLVQALMDAYHAELGAHAIALPRETFDADALRYALVDQMEMMPWLLSQYLRRRGDESYAGWCAWAAQAIPHTLAHIRGSIEKGHLHRVQR